MQLHGPGRVEVDINFAGTVIAPEGHVVLSGAGTTQRGAFFARLIEVGSDVTLLHTDPLAPR